MKAMSKFGGPTVVPAVAALLDSGRLLAVRAADGWWSAWDTATGNRLPSRQPLGDLTKYQSRAESFLDAAELRQFETTLTGRPPAELAAAPVRPWQGCVSDDGRFSVAVTLDAQRVQAATLKFPDGHTVDLASRGMEPSSWVVRPYSPVGTTTANCSLSPDGAFLAVQRLARDSVADKSAKATSDRLVVYDLRGGGARSCELETDYGAAPIAILPGDLRFSADGSLIAAASATGERSLRIFDGASCKELHLPVGAGPVLGFSPDARTVTGAMQPASNNVLDAYGLLLWDVAALRGGSAARPIQIPDAIGSIEVAVFGGNGRTLLVPDNTHALQIWDRVNGVRLGALRALQEGEWLVTTPEGFFDGSPRAWTTFAWRESNAELATKPPEIFFNEFYRPGLLAELLDGRRPQGPRSIADVDRRQPIVAIATEPAETSADVLPLELTVEESPASGKYATPSGARDLRLFRNGSLVKVWRGDLPLVNGRATVRIDVPLVPGENRLSAYVFNRDNVKSADAVAVVRSLAPPTSATAYVIAVGVNRYANPEFNLSFAAPDATRFSAILAQRYQELGKFGKVVAVGLYDGEATGANMLLALSRLAGRADPLPAGAPQQLGELRRARAQDSVLFYFAGHGVAVADRFYLVPHDLGYAGSRSELRQSIQSVVHSSISDQDLERAFESIDTANSILIIDACASGKALDAEEQRRGPLNSKGLAQLAYEKGMYVLTASQAYQAAIESSRLGHGYLTFALAEEGLNSPAADVSPANGEVTVTELFDYAVRRVPQLQIEALDAASRASRALVFEEGTQLQRGVPRLQTPRVYYRREEAGPSPVLWKR